MKILWNIAMLGLLVGSSATILMAQTEKGTVNACFEHNQRIKKTLAKDNVLFHALDQNHVGTGVTMPWMITLEMLHVKQATADIYFDVEEDRLEFRLKSIGFFREYYNFAPLSRVSNLENGERADLTQRLKLPFFASATAVLGHLDLRGKSNCGHVYLSLLDDSCLPVLNDMPQLQAKCGDSDE